MRIATFLIAAVYLLPFHLACNRPNPDNDLRLSSGSSLLDDSGAPLAPTTLQGTIDDSRLTSNARIDAVAAGDLSSDAMSAGDLTAVQPEEVWSCTMPANFAPLNVGGLGVDSNYDGQIEPVSIATAGYDTSDDASSDVQVGCYTREGSTSEFCGRIPEGATRTDRVVTSFLRATDCPNPNPRVGEPIGRTGEGVAVFQLARGEAVPDCSLYCLDDSNFPCNDAAGTIRGPSLIASPATNCPVFGALIFLFFRENDQSRWINVGFPTNEDSTISEDYRERFKNIKISCAGRLEYFRVLNLPLGQYKLEIRATGLEPIMRFFSISQLNAIRQVTDVSHDNQTITLSATDPYNIAEAPRMFADATMRCEAGADFKMYTPGNTPPNNCPDVPVATNSCDN